MILACALATAFADVTAEAESARRPSAQTTMETTGETTGAPLDLHVPAEFKESLTVIGRRPFVLAPLPGQNDVAPAPTGLAPGSKLGPFVVTGGPTDGLASRGVSAGLTIPIKAVKGLEFGIQFQGSRDALAPTGTAAAAGVFIGFKLRF